MPDPRELPSFDPLGIAYRTGILGEYPDRLNIAGEALLNPLQTARLFFEQTGAGDVQDAVAGSTLTADAVRAGDPMGALAGVGMMGLGLAGTVLPGRPAQVFDPVAEAYRQANRQAMGYTTPMYHGMLGKVAQEIPHMEPFPAQRGLPSDPNFKGQLGDFGIHLTPDPETAARGIGGGQGKYLDMLKKQADLHESNGNFLEAAKLRNEIDQVSQDFAILPFMVQTPNAVRMNDLGRWDNPGGFGAEYTRPGSGSWSSRVTIPYAQVDDPSYGRRIKYYEPVELRDETASYDPHSSWRAAHRGMADHDPAFLEDMVKHYNDTRLLQEKVMYHEGAAAYETGMPHLEDYRVKDAEGNQIYDAPGVPKMDKEAFQRDFKQWSQDKGPEYLRLMDEYSNANPHQFWQEGFARIANKHGYNSVVYGNAIEGKGEDSFMYFDPADVRSAHAKFDPARRYDKDMLASIAALTGVGVGSAVGLDAYLSGRDDSGGPGL